MTTDIEMKEPTGLITLSKDETAVYDRQIRLWGIDAQNKLRNSKVLLLGGSQLGVEVAKTVSLAGVSEMHLIDNEKTDALDIGRNFTYDASADNMNNSKMHAAFNFLHNLNKNVKLEVKDYDLFSKTDQEIEEYVQNFTVVIILDNSYENTKKLNEICRKYKIRFIAGGVFGWIGYAFFDFNGHSFLTKVEKPVDYTYIEGEAPTDEKPTITIEDIEFAPKVWSYPSFEEAFNSDWSDKKWHRKCRRNIPSSYFIIKSLLRASKEISLTGNEDADIAELTRIWHEEVKAGNQEIESQTVQPDKFDHFFPPQFSPSAAVLGGFIGQETIKTISEEKLPLKNIITYSAIESIAYLSSFPFSS